ncbi:hypothetical protein C8R44DRAFT_776262 [Mycena epipterygia]|nr:hypothetical protein C8R44DRAFT_776262 [Mycena epipterygia]
MRVPHAHMHACRKSQNTILRPAMGFWLSNGPQHGLPVLANRIRTEYIYGLHGDRDQGSVGLLSTSPCRPLWKIAEALHPLTRAPALTSSDELHSTVRWLAAQPDKRQIRQGFHYGSGSLILSQWNKFDVRQCV